MAEEQKRWERLEEFLFDHHELGSDFSAVEYADGMDFAYVADATADIQSYLRAQRSPRSTTLYVLQRVPSTRARKARWIVGEKTVHARSVGTGLADDVANRVKRAYLPDLNRIGTIRPRTTLVHRQTELIDHGLALFAAAAQGMGFEEES